MSSILNSVSTQQITAKRFKRNLSVWVHFISVWPEHAFIAEFCLACRLYSFPRFVGRSSVRLCTETCIIITVIKIVHKAEHGMDIGLSY